jgi:hypothetical protein
MSTTVVNTLYHVPTVDDFDGTESFALIDPKRVSSITPDTADVGMDEKARTITGSRVFIGLDEQYFVPLSPNQIAHLLNLEVKETVCA